MPAVTVQQAFALAVQHHQAGRLVEAEGLYRQVLAVQPDFAGAYNNLGGALRSLGRVDEAIAAFQEARRLDQGMVEAHENLGDVLKERGLFEDAAAVYLELLQRRPEYAAGYHQLGIAYARMGQAGKALSAYENALRLKPDFPEALNNKGVASRELRQLPGAIESFRGALQLDPDSPEAHYNLGNVLKDMGQLDEARQEFERAVGLKPTYADACNGLANILKDQARPDAALAQFRRALELAPDDAALHSNLICMLHYSPSQSVATIAAEQRRWNEKFCVPWRGRIPPHGNDRTPDRRLRIGYVSADFRDHVVGHYLLPLLRGHDHAAFEIFGYSGVACPDRLTEMIRGHVHHWRHCVGMSDEALSAMIRRDGVDILVDLSQHLSGNRLRVFAQQPAPVEVSFAGYPESTGVESIAYRISDRFLEPRWGEKENDRGEEILLVDTFMCYEPAESDVETHALPAGELGYVTFGNLNNFCKVNERALRVWARVLTEVKGSRLLFLSPRGSHRQQTVELLGREGIEAQRIEFCEPRPRRQYLELYGKVDIALDPFPYNGHTTSLDALWMGVPVVSLVGERAVSRAGLSQLTNLGLPELVAHTEDEYVAIATRLAHDLPRLTELRATLRGRMEASVLMDAPRFARQIEDAYRAMWRRWCAEEKGA
ncbi:MAG: tetratricopeptide repeat protein [Chthoniobacter sp.]|nr:tetratricopeptide repeat protein [Chthoniobacter sp.]